MPLRWWMRGLGLLSESLRWGSGIVGGASFTESEKGSSSGSGAEEVDARGLLRVCLRALSENLGDVGEDRPKATFSTAANCSRGAKSKFVRETLSWYTGGPKADSQSLSVGRV